MRDLAKYSFTNAKVRAMLSCLISPPLFQQFLDAKDTSEFIDILKETPYKDILEHFAIDENNLEALEKEFLKRDLAIYKKVYGALSSRHEKEFVLMFMAGYEIEELKVILRLWNKKMPVKIEDYLIGEAIRYDIDFDKILHAQTIEEIILILDDTPYKKPLMSVKDTFKKKGSVFYLEAAIDADYYKRLFLCIENFSSADKKIAKKILGIKIDIENINALMRLKKYHSIGIGEMLPYFIPGGDAILKDSVIGAYTSNGISSIVDSLAIGPYTRVKDFAESNMALIDTFLSEILLKEIKHALSGFPFTIGTILGYLLLKHNETKHVVSLLYAKKCGFTKDEAVSLMNIC